MIAITNKMWIKLPTLNAKNPTAHAITKITAIKYNRFDIIIEF